MAGCAKSVYTPVSNKTEGRARVRGYPLFLRGVQRKIKMENEQWQQNEEKNNQVQPKRSQGERLVTAITLRIGLLRTLNEYFVLSLRLLEWERLFDSGILEMVGSTQSEWLEMVNHTRNMCVLTKTWIYSLTDLQKTLRVQKEQSEQMILPGFENVMWEDRDERLKF
jgi:hypothetical protein